MSLVNSISNDRIADWKLYCQLLNKGRKRMRSKDIVLLLLISSVSSLNVASFAGETEVKADNTKQNKYDQVNDRPEAQDQSNEKTSVQLVSNIRKDIMSKKGFSVNAQNIKIIDEKGTVYLRGPVDSDNEKSKLESIAKKYCGNCYKSELEVKTH